MSDAFYNAIGRFGDTSKQKISEFKDFVFDRFINEGIKEASALAVAAQPFNGVPSHSQLAKDREIHPLHSLSKIVAGKLAADVGGMMSQIWRTQSAGGSTDTLKAGLRSYVSDLFSHPMDKPNAFIDAITQAWYKNNQPVVPRLRMMNDFQYRPQQTLDFLQHKQQRGKNMFESIIDWHERFRRPASSIGG